MNMMKSLTIILAIVMLAPALLRAQATPTTNPTNPANPSTDPTIAAFLKRIEPARGDDELVQKLKERHNAAVHLLELRVDEYHHGLTPFSPVFDAARTVGDAKLDLATSDDDRMKVMQQEIDVTKVVEDRLQKQMQAGFGSQADVERAKLARLSAEVELLKLKAHKSSPTTRP